LGGDCTAPDPVQYCIYGLIACYAATFARWAAMEGIVLKSFKIKAAASMEKLNKLNELAKEQCPGYYCVRGMRYSHKLK